MNKITVVGAGYVGLANAFLMGINKKVTLIDIDKEKINMLSKSISPINDEYITKYISEVSIDYTYNKEEAYKEADYIFVATDTNYDENLNKFDLKSIEGALKDIADYAQENTVITIKSTIPVGYTDDLQKRYPQYKFIFSPEFLREGYALHDNLNPDRIIVGGNNFPAEAKEVGQLLAKNLIAKNVPILYLSNKEAEVIKLFANTYLAMRVSFVNELDSFCQSVGMKASNVLDGIGYDHRIGRHYFNPSFGYGGYCLPKDTKQLKSEFKKNHVPEELMTSIVNSNLKRKEFIVEETLKRLLNNEKKVVGIYRVISKKGINNFRASAMIDIANILVNKGVEVIIYEPYANDEINGIKVLKDFKEFENKSNIILANRKEEKIENNNKVYTTDVYEEY